MFRNLYSCGDVNCTSSKTGELVFVLLVYPVLLELQYRKGGVINMASIQHFKSTEFPN